MVTKNVVSMVLHIKWDIDLISFERIYNDANTCHFKQQINVLL